MTQHDTLSVTGASEKLGTCNSNLAPGYATPTLSLPREREPRKTAVFEALNRSGYFHDHLHPNDGTQDRETSSDEYVP